MSKSPSPPFSSTRRGRETISRDFELFDELMPVRRYKLLLQTFLKRRGSGSRQAIAEALGNTRSFVTQLTSPAYELAIPAQHALRIVELARLEPDEKRMFLDAYVEAHPERTAEILGHAFTSGARCLKIDVPLLASETAQRHLERTIQKVAGELIETFLSLERDKAADADTDDTGPAA